MSRLAETMTSRVECPDGFTEVRHIAPFHFDGPACPHCSDAEYADRMQREDPCLICRLLPDYEAAIEALERIARPIGSGYEGDVQDREALVRWMVAEAREALRRLREVVPA